MHPDDDHRAAEDLIEVRALLETIDHPVPAVSAASVIALARARRRRQPSRWAAAILLTLGGAGAALAAPGSPVPGWVAAVAARLAGRTETPSAIPARAPAADRGSAGIAVAPGRALAVVFTSANAGGLVRVSIGDGDEVVVRAPAGAATFTAGTDRLIVEDRDAPDTFAIEIPRAAARVELLAGAERLLLAERGRVTGGIAPDTLSVYQVPLPAARPR